MAGRFGFIVPLNHREAGGIFFLPSWIPQRVAEAVYPLLPPLRLGRSAGICSSTNEAQGFFCGVGLTGRQILSLPAERVIAKIVAAGRLLEREGVRIIGLGGAAALVGEGGRAVAERLQAGVTTGISYEVHIALEGVRAGAAWLGWDLGEAEVAVLGACEAPGRLWCALLAEDCRRVTLVDRDEAGLEAAARGILREWGVSAQVSTDLKKAAARADLIIVAAGLWDLAGVVAAAKPGAVICNAAWRLPAAGAGGAERADVLLIEGGVVEVPGDLASGAGHGPHPRHCTAALAETMVLALEERYEDYTVGEACSPERVREIARLASKHGFRLSGLWGSGRVLTREDVERVRSRAKERGGEPPSCPSLDNDKAG